MKSICVAACLVVIAGCSGQGPGADDSGSGGGSAAQGGGSASAGGGVASAGGGVASAGGGVAGAGGGVASTGGGAATDAGMPDAGVTPQWLLAPAGITASQLAVLVNTNDTLSVLTADRYMAARHLPPENRIDLAFPLGGVMSVDDFTAAKAQVDARLDGGIQALALTWTNPYRVDCMSVTTAFAAGYDAGAFCSTPCNPTAYLPTYDSASHTPYTDYKILPTMMLASTDAGNAYALIDRGIASDGTLPGGHGYFVRTTDAARSVRYFEFLQTVQTFTGDGGLEMTYLDETDGGPNAVRDAGDVLFYFTSLASVPDLTTNTYRPGAVADHLTSYGGQVPQSGQMSCLRWLEAGATASYGTVVEPCNYTSKFPETTVMTEHYFRGEPVIEAYWKSVSMPGEGLFIGEPLAHPFDADVTHYDAATGTLTLTTNRLVPFKSYSIESADSPAGPWASVQTNLMAQLPRRLTLSVHPATAKYYRLQP